MDKYPAVSPELDKLWFNLDGAPRTPVEQHPQLPNMAWASIEATALTERAEEEARTSLAAYLGNQALSGVQIAGQSFANETQYTVQQFFGARPSHN